MSEYTDRKRVLSDAAAWEPNEIGIFTGIPMRAYLDAPGVNRSLLRTVAERPSAHEAKSESSQVQQWGTLFNDLVLFGTREFYVRPDTYEALVKGVQVTKPWNGNATACEEWLAAHTDKPVLRATGDHSAEWLNRAAEKLLADRRFQEVQSVCPQKEVSIFARHEEHANCLIKCRPDMLGLHDSRAVFADIKTTTNAGTHAFSRDMLRFGYHKQFALIRHALHQHRYSPVHGFLVIVEKGENPRVQVRQLAERAMDKGDLDLDDDFTIYLRCRMANAWPDFADEPESHITGVIDLPEHCYAGEIDEIKASTEEALS